MAFTYNQAGEKTGEVMVMDDGREKTSTFENGIITGRTILDLDDAFGWSRIEQSFDDQGELISETRTENDGSVRQIQYNVAPVVSLIDAGSVTEDDAALIINLLDGASDANGDSLSAVNITATDENGDAVAFTDNGDSTISIDPDQFGDVLDEGDSRTVTVSYGVSDGVEETANTATLVVSGSTDNRSPIAVDDVFSPDVAPTPLVNDIQVNTATEGRQQYASLAALPDGGFVATWSSYSETTKRFDVFAQLYDANASPIGEEFQVNSFALSSRTNQFWSAATALANSDFVITWAGTGSESEANSYFQRYSADGTPLGEETAVDDRRIPSVNSPAIAALDDGGFIIVWIDQIGNEGIVYGRTFDAAGNALGDKFRVNEERGDTTATEPQVVATPDGVLISWSNIDEDANKPDIFARSFDANGNGSAEFLVNTTTGSTQVGSHIVVLEDGGALITWSALLGSLWVVHAQRYDAQGNAVGEEFRSMNTPDLMLFIQQV